MNKNWELSQEAFDALLDWLDPDREQAGSKYEQIRLRLIKIFTGRGCVDAEDLADETINRVTTRLQTLEKDFSGDRARYFFGVANKLYMEYLRRKPPQLPPWRGSDSARIELEYSCLERCIERLSDENRELLLQYYGVEGRPKVEHRKALADRFGIGPNALRLRAFRIRLGLQDCVGKCLAAVPAKSGVLESDTERFIDNYSPPSRRVSPH
jgi:DNA-directed RNA polymerase specialized sigma24 family protein